MKVGKFPKKLKVSKMASLVFKFEFSNREILKKVEGLKDDNFNKWSRVFEFKFSKS